MPCQPKGPGFEMGDNIKSFTIPLVQSTQYDPFGSATTCTCTVLPLPNKPLIDCNAQLLDKSMTEDIL